MLALTRKLGQSIVIGGLDGGGPLVTVAILEIQQGRILLGFTTSKEVSIHREEVWIPLQRPGTNSVEFFDEQKAVASDSVGP